MSKNPDNDYSEYYSVWDDSPETHQELNDFYKQMKEDEGWDG